MAIEHKPHHVFHALRLLVLLQLALGLAGTSTLMRQVNAGGGGGSTYNFRLSINKQSIVANGNDSATVNVSYYHFRCNDGSAVYSAEACNYGGGVQGEIAGPDVPLAAGKFKIVISGASATASKSHLDGASSDSFTVKGTASGTATITVADADSSDNYVLGEKNSVAVTITAVPAPPPAAKPTEPRPPTPTAPTTTLPGSQQAPESPRLTTTTTGGSIIATPDKGFEVSSNDDVVLTGTALPKATVDIYVFSEEQHFTTTSDDKGQWSYTIARGSLQPGDHHVEVAVTHPQTKLTSPRTTVAAFTIKHPAQAPMSEGQQTQLPDSSSTQALAWIVLAILAIAGLGAVASYILYRRHKKAHHASLTPTPLA